MRRIEAWFADTQPWGRQTVRLGAADLNVLVAITPAQWAQGLAGHGDDETMLFIMPPGSRCPFGMRGVDHPLAIGFFDDGGHMVDVGFMDARRGTKWPRRPYRYALEVPLGNRPAILALLGGGASRLEL